jgi:predicted SprT family Zn-dependent metalloprotease
MTNNTKKNELKQIEQWITECLSILKHEHIKIPFEFNGRLKRSLGRAHLSVTSFKMDFASRYWENIPLKAKREIVFHEVCHIIDFILTGDSSHGLPWKRLMSKVGYPLARLAIPKNELGLN